MQWSVVAACWTYSISRDEGDLLRYDIATQPETKLNMRRNTTGTRASKGTKILALHECSMVHAHSLNIST